MANDIVVMFEGTIYENGYGWVAQKVMRDKDLKPQAKAIYAYICSMAGNPKDIDNRTAFPSVSLMMEELGFKSDDTFYKYMKQLKDKGYLIVEQEKDEKGRFKRNIYKVVAVPEPKSNDGEEVKKEEKKENPNPKKSSTEKNNNPYPKNSSSEKSSSEKLGTNSISFNSNNTNNTNKDLSITELDIQSLSLPMPIKKRLIMNIDRLIRDDIDIDLIVTLYNTYKDRMNDFQFAAVLENVLRFTKGKIKNISNLMHKAVKSFFDDLDKIDETNKVERPKHSVRRDILPKWMMKKEGMQFDFSKRADLLGY